MAAATSEKAVQQILNGLQKRAESLPTDRWGIGTAAMYLRKLAVPENTTPEKWESVLKAAASKLTYCEKGMVIEGVRLLSKTGGKSGDWTPGGA